MKGAEEDYLELEKKLDEQIRQMESTHPGYDEFIQIVFGQNICLRHTLEEMAQHNQYTGNDFYIIDPFFSCFYRCLFTHYFVSMGEQIGDYVERNFNRAINLAYFPVLGLFAVGDIAAVLFFGREYVEAGTFLRIVVFQTFFMFVITCTQGLEIVLRKQKYSLISTVVQSIFIVISIYVGKLADNVCISIILMVCVYCVIQVVYYTKLFDVMNKSMKPYIKKMVGCLVSIALIAIVVRFGCKAVIDRFDIEILNWFNVGLSFRN